MATVGANVYGTPIHIGTHCCHIGIMGPENSNVWRFDEQEVMSQIEYYRTTTRYTSAAYVTSSITCSEPRLLTAPQWRWNWTRRYLSSSSGPPRRAMYHHTVNHPLTQTCTQTVLTHASTTYYAPVSEQCFTSPPTQYKLYGRRTMHQPDYDNMSFKKS